MKLFAPSAKFTGLYTSFLVVVFLSVAFSNVNAADTLTDGITRVGTEIAGPGSGLFQGDIADVLAEGINWLLSFAALLALAALVWGGISYIISFGEDDKAKKAKNVIKYAIIGLVITGLSFAIITTVQSFL